MALLLLSRPGPSSATRATVGVLGTLATFQAALAAGAPWGAAAYGGGHPGRLPGRLRGTSAVASVGYAVAATTLARESGSDVVRRRLLTGVLALTGVGTVLNAVSRSPVERAWAPVCLFGGVAAWRARRDLGG
jgi:hypothetical protein